MKTSLCLVTDGLEIGWSVGSKIKSVVLSLRCILESSEGLLKVKSEILLLLVWDGAQALVFLKLRNIICSIQPVLVTSAISKDGDTAEGLRTQTETRRKLGENTKDRASAGRLHSLYLAAVLKPQRSLTVFFDQ